MYKVAITGCASRFARVLLPLLEADQEIEQIVGVDRVPPMGSYSKLVFHEGDVRDSTIGAHFVGCEALIHLAFIVLRPYRISVQETADINLRGTWNTCHAAAEMGVRKIVVSSSIAAYGSLPDNPEPLVEQSPLRGLYNNFYYSQHKHANEIWLDKLQLEFPRVIITRLRPCVVIGPSQSGVNSIIHANNSHFSSPVAHKSRMQLVHEDDLAAAFHATLQHDLLGAFNVVGDGPDTQPNIAANAGLQVIEMPEALLMQQAREAWKKGLSDIGPEWVGSGESSIICSNAKLKATGYWSPRYTTTEALAATVQALAQSTANPE